MSPDTASDLISDRRTSSNPDGRLLLERYTATVLVLSPSPIDFVSLFFFGRRQKTSRSEATPLLNRVPPH